MDQGGRAVGDCAVVRLLEQRGRAVLVYPGVDHHDFRRAPQSEGADRRRNCAAGECLVSHQTLERHRSHPAWALAATALDPPPSDGLLAPTLFTSLPNLLAL